MGGKGSGQRGTKVTRICKLCGKEFQCLKSHQTKFCDEECRRQYIIGLQRTDYGRVNTREICVVAVDELRGVYSHLQPIVGKIYPATEAHIRNNMTFCHIEIGGKPIIMRKCVKGTKTGDWSEPGEDGKTVIYTRSEYMEVANADVCPVCGREKAAAYVRGGEIIGCMGCTRLMSVHSIPLREEEHEWETG